MLDVKRNRLDYGQLLIPPEGHRLTQAVATAYSVDLDTLLSIPVALYYAQTLEGQLQGKAVELIRAIQHTARVLTIYHQEGQLRVPRVAKDIYAYFEDSLVPILPDGAFTSFHPKTWVLRYEHEESADEVVYRLIVLSRNLTFDRSWNVAGCLEGKPEDATLAWNKPLVDFHAWLDQQRPIDNSALFLDELARVNFEVPHPFDDYAFYPTFHPGARETRIDVTDPVYGKMLGQVCLRPVNLEHLESLVSDVTLVGKRNAASYAIQLAFGKTHSNMS